jgi:hypothetical protein
MTLKVCIKKGIQINNLATSRSSLTQLIDSKRLFSEKGYLTEERLIFQTDTGWLSRNAEIVIQVVDFKRFVEDSTSC